MKQILFYELNNGAQFIHGGMTYTKIRDRRTEEGICNALDPNNNLIFFSRYEIVYVAD